METNHDDEANPILAKLKEFATSIKDHQPIVFCVKCGSTLIDQTAIYSLTCLKCRNNILWDGYSFAIARDGSAYDAASSFQNAEHFGDYFKDWHFSMIKALQEFSRTTINTVFKVVSDESGEGFDLDKSGSDYHKLVEEWNQCKAKIDELLSKNKEGTV